MEEGELVQVPEPSYMDDKGRKTKSRSPSPGTPSQHPGGSYNPAYEWPGSSSRFTPEYAIYDSYGTNQGLDDRHIDSHVESTARLPGHNSEAYDAPRATSAPNRSSSSHFLRLIVLRSGILPRKHRLALVDGHTEVQFGRDVAPAGSDTPRVRLKEMEVSKVHASVYWDSGRRNWGVVDMGSKHGTFLQRASPPRPCPSDDDLTPEKPATGVDLGNAAVVTRLSQSRSASVPRFLQHNDQLSIGSTTFLVHIHKEHPCEECSPNPGEEIPLFPRARKESAAVSLKRSRDIALLDNESKAMPSSSDPKKALTMLKRSLLTRHDSSSVSVPNSRSASPSANASSYIDRSARRRALHPSTAIDSPGISTPLNPPRAPYADTETIMPRTSLPTLRCQSPRAEISPQPLSSSNIGFRMLMGQGWAPGNALGVLSDDDTSNGRIGLVEPLSVHAGPSRAGLGMSNTAGQAGTTKVSDRHWRENGKFKRWDDGRPGEEYHR